MIMNFKNLSHRTQRVVDSQGTIPWKKELVNSFALRRDSLLSRSHELNEAIEAKGYFVDFSIDRVASVDLQIGTPEDYEHGLIEDLDMDLVPQDVKALWDELLSVLDESYDLAIEILDALSYDWDGGPEGGYTYGGPRASRYENADWYSIYLSNDDWYNPLEGLEDIFSAAGL